MSEKIQKIYAQPNQTSTMIPFILFLIVLSLFGSLYANVQRKLLHQSGEGESCNPRYVFFSGFLNPFQKDPWGATEKNFQKCVTTHMYRDPGLTKQIALNRTNIQTQKKTIGENFKLGYDNVQEVKQSWKNDEKKSVAGLSGVEGEMDQVFTSQYTLHAELVKKMRQLYYVIDAILKYIQTVLQIRVGEEKMTLSIESKHNSYMERYNAIHQDYLAANSEYAKGNYRVAVQKAQSAIEKYNKIEAELDLFMKDHSRTRTYITRGCYRLKNTFKNEKCNEIFPHLDWNEINTLMSKR